jgi:hypothetical protein
MERPEFIAKKSPLGRATSSSFLSLEPTLPDPLPKKMIFTISHPWTQATRVTRTSGKVGLYNYIT